MPSEGAAQGAVDGIYEGKAYFAACAAAMAILGRGAAQENSVQSGAKAGGRGASGERKKTRSDAKLEEALAFLGQGFDASDITVFSYLLGAAALLCALALDAAVIALLAPRFIEVLLFLIMPSMFVPMIVVILAINYPHSASRRLRNRCLGYAPDAVNYMIMSLKLNRSLDRAVDFAAENVEEPFASHLRKIKWDVYVKRFSSIEDSFLAFASEWGGYDEDFKRALFAIKSASGERSDEGLSRAADKAASIILSGTKARTEAFASSLSGPITILFALGILMPMIVGAMMPMVALGNLDMNNFASAGSAAQGAGGEAASGGSTTMLMILLMDVAFPAATFSYAFYILGKRPGAVSKAPSQKAGQKSHDAGEYSGETQSGPSSKRLANAIAAIAILASFWAMAYVLSPQSMVLSSALALLGAALSISYWCLFAYRADFALARKVAKMEDEFPDALFLVGSRVSEGMPLEESMKRAAEGMKGTQVAVIFDQAAYNIQLRRAELSEILFGSAGILNNVGSRAIKASMRAAVEMVKKDAQTAGQTIVSISAHLKDLKKLEGAIKTQIGSTTDMMRTTSTVFAPIVLGITVSLYGTLSGVFLGLGASSMMDAWLFILVMGVYLILTLVATMYFCAGLFWGGDRAALANYVGTNLPVAVIIYAVMVLLGGSVMGV